MRTRRSAYTLLEVLLSLLIATMLLAALYSAVGFQLRSAQAGRDVVGETTFARSIVSRIENDVIASVALPDASRHRVQADQEAQQQQQAATATGSTTGTSPTTGSAASSTSTGTTSTTTGSTGTTTESTDMAANPLTQPTTIPLGVMGDNTSLTIFATKVPGELYGVRPGDGGQLVSDIRRITYWLADGGAGMCRQEIRIATAEEALSQDLPSDVANYLIAPEVKSLEFRYFDGSGWVDSWDSTTLGDDGVTPIGSPRAIEVRVGILPPGKEGEDTLKYYRYTIAIPTANGITQATTNGGGTTP